MYNRQKVYEYAKKWAYGRNPKYYNYDLIGGDCTNFISQCIYAGCGQMNYDRYMGWYYINANNKSPSWTGVEFLCNFLLQNKGVGPKGKIIDIKDLKVGDIVQLSFNGDTFAHSLIVIQNGINESNTLIAAHTDDTFGKSVAEYEFKKYRCIHVEI